MNDTDRTGTAPIDAREHDAAGHCGPPVRAKVVRDITSDHDGSRMIEADLTFRVWVHVLDDPHGGRIAALSNASVQRYPEDVSEEIDGDVCSFQVLHDGTLALCPGSTPDGVSWAGCDEGAPREFARQVCAALNDALGPAPTSSGGKS